MLKTINKHDQRALRSKGSREDVLNASKMEVSDYSGVQTRHVALCAAFGSEVSGGICEEQQDQNHLISSIGDFSGKL